MCMCVHRPVGARGWCWLPLYFILHTIETGSLYKHRAYYYQLDHLTSKALGMLQSLFFPLPLCFTPGFSYVYWESQFKCHGYYKVLHQQRYLPRPFSVSWTFQITCFNNDLSFISLCLNLHDLCLLIVNLGEQI